MKIEKKKAAAAAAQHLESRGNVQKENNAQVKENNNEDELRRKSGGTKYNDKKTRVTQTEQNCTGRERVSESTINRKQRAPRLILLGCGIYLHFRSRQRLPCNGNSLVFFFFFLLHKEGNKGNAKKNTTQTLCFFAIAAAAAAVSPFLSFSVELLSLSLCGVFKDTRRFYTQK